jgi:hypothetical protein
MPRYLSVESEPAVISCYRSGARFVFVNYDNFIMSICVGCSTPLFLPRELEAMARPVKGRK